MKDLDNSAAPMISVPASVLKDFMAPNSRTPTPPPSSSTSPTTIPESTLTTTVTTSSASPMSPSITPTSQISNTTSVTTTATTTTSVVGVKSRTPTPTPNSRTSSPTLPVPKEKTSVTITPAAVVTGLLNGQADENEIETVDVKEDVKASKENVPVMNGMPSSATTPSPGLKREHEDEDSNGKPDLKKIRVFPTDKDGFKRDVNVTVKEVNEALDLESKKYLEAKKRNVQNLLTLRHIKNGIAALNGGTDSPVHSPISAVPSPSTTGHEREGGLTPSLDQTSFRENKENLGTGRGREVRLTKNGLKDTILRVFSDNTLYGSELGRLKQMCEKLTSTLESNMRKVAQFHKEIEDLRKVTTRLAAEHQARKGQYVAPIRIKRSVGIQAAPHIINKGIMHASVSGGSIKTISPRSTGTPSTSSVVGVLPSSVGQSLLPGGTLGIITTTSGVRPAGTITGVTTASTALTGATVASSLGTAVRAPNGQIMMMAPAGAMQPLVRPAPAGVNATTVLPVTQGRVVRAPLGNISTVAPQAGTLIGTQRPILIQNDKGAATAIQTTLPAGRAGGVIDLTDEDEGNKMNATRASSMVPKPGTVVKVPTSATAQLVPLQLPPLHRLTTSPSHPTQAGGVGQVVLLPNTSGGQPTTALIVSQVSTGQPLDTVANPAVAQARISTVVNHTSSATRVQGSTPPAPTRAASTAAPPSATLPQQSSQMRHPAPLPKTPFQQVGGISKKLPPQPTLKLSHKDSSIVLSWTMAKTEDHETIASYQLYAYQEGAAPPSASLWKKVGSVKALELPMACTLTQFMPGHVYHFAVRAVDTKSRLGPFSEPRSIRLDKK